MSDGYYKCDCGPIRYSTIGEFFSNAPAGTIVKIGSFEYKKTDYPASDCGIAPSGSRWVKLSK